MRGRWNRVLLCMKTHRQGSAYFNTLFQRYLKSQKFIKNSTSQAEIRKFKSYVEYFKKYGAEYNFDYLMLAAQGYQESMLQQDRVSPRGAVGVMQVLPQYAAASPINISNVHNAESNIHGHSQAASLPWLYLNKPSSRNYGKRRSRLRLRARCASMARHGCIRSLHGLM